MVAFETLGSLQGHSTRLQRTKPKQKISEAKSQEKYGDGLPELGIETERQTARKRFVFKAEL